MAYKQWVDCCIYFSIFFQDLEIFIINLVSYAQKSLRNSSILGVRDQQLIPLKSFSLDEERTTDMMLPLVPIVVLAYAALYIFT